MKLTTIAVKFGISSNAPILGDNLSLHLIALMQHSTEVFHQLGVEHRFMTKLSDQIRCSFPTTPLRISHCSPAG